MLDLLTSILVKVIYDEWLERKLQYQVPLGVLGECLGRVWECLGLVASSSPNTSHNIYKTYEEEALRWGSWGGFGGAGHA